ncbi:SANTA domain-containing protein [Pseudoscourfieldia marina]
MPLPIRTRPSLDDPVRTRAIFDRAWKSPPPTIGGGRAFSSAVQQVAFSPPPLNSHSPGDAAAASPPAVSPRGGAGVYGSGMAAPGSSPRNNVGGNGGSHRVGGGDVVLDVDVDASRNGNVGGRNAPASASASAQQQTTGAGGATQQQMVRPRASYGGGGGVAASAEPANLVRRRFDALVRTSPVARALGGPGYLARAASANNAHSTGDIPITAWSLLRLPDDDAQSGGTSGATVAITGTGADSTVVTTGVVLERLGARRIKCRRQRGTQVITVILQGDMDASALRARGFGGPVERTFVHGFPPVWQGILIADSLAKKSETDVDTRQPHAGPSDNTPKRMATPSNSDAGNDDDSDDDVPIALTAIDDDDDDGGGGDQLLEPEPEPKPARRQPRSAPAGTSNARKATTHVPASPPGASKELRNLLDQNIPARRDSGTAAESSRASGRRRNTPKAWWAETVDLTGGNDKEAKKALADAKAKKEAADAPPPARSRKKVVGFDPCRPAQQGDYAGPQPAHDAGTSNAQASTPPPPPPASTAARRRQRTAPNTVPVRAPRAQTRPPPTKAAGKAAIKRAVAKPKSASSLRKKASPHVDSDDSEPALQPAPCTSPAKRVPGSSKPSVRASLAAAAAEARKKARGEEQAVLNKAAALAPYPDVSPRKDSSLVVQPKTAAASASASAPEWAELPTMADGVGAGAETRTRGKKRLRKKSGDAGAAADAEEPPTKRRAKAPRFGIVMYEDECDVGMGEGVAVPAQQARVDGWGKALARAAGRAVGTAKSLVADGTTEVAPRRGAAGEEAAQRRRGRAAAWATKVNAAAPTTEGGLAGAMGALNADQARGFVEEFGERRRAGRYVDAALRSQRAVSTAVFEAPLPSMEEGVGALAQPAQPVDAPQHRVGRNFAASAAAAAAAAATTTALAEQEEDDAFEDDDYW